MHNAIGMIMKMSIIVAGGLLSLSVVGCKMDMEHSMKFKTMGSVCLSERRPIVSAEFECPPSRQVFLLLVIQDGNQKATAQHLHPLLDLSMTVQVMSSERKNTVLSNCISSTSMRYANWHTPATSVIIDTDPMLGDILQPGIKYQLEVSLENKILSTNQAAIVLEWVEDEKQ